jgi:hypothetical protein
MKLSFNDSFTICIYRCHRVFHPLPPTKEGELGGEGEDNPAIVAACGNGKCPLPNPWWVFHCHISSAVTTNMGT